MIIDITAKASYMPQVKRSSSSPADGPFSRYGDKRALFGKFMLKYPFFAVRYFFFVTRKRMGVFGKQAYKTNSGNVTGVKLGVNFLKSNTKQIKETPILSLTEVTEG